MCVGIAGAGRGRHHEGVDHNKIPEQVIRTYVVSLWQIFLASDFWVVSASGIGFIAYTCFDLRSDSNAFAHV